MIRRPPRSTRTDTLLPYTTLFRSRDMLLARILGAGLAADCFQLAFRLPNTFRRLFAEGAFSAAYVPMFSRELQGPGGQADAERFSQDVLSVFVPVLLV